MTNAPISEPWVLARLNEDHNRLERVLECFEHQYEALRSGATPNYELVRDVLDYVQSFPNVIHHPTEDVLFDYLAKGDLGPEEAKLVEENHDQHERILADTHRLVTAVDAILKGGVADTEALKSEMGAYLEAQRHHLHVEQEYLFPLADSRLTPADWDEIEFELTMAEDPLFDTTERQFEILRQHIIEQDDRA